MKLLYGKKLKDITITTNYNCKKMRQFTIFMPTRLYTEDFTISYFIYKELNYK